MKENFALLESADEFFEAALHCISRGWIDSAVGLLATARNMFAKLGMTQHVATCDAALMYYKPLH